MEQQRDFKELIRLVKTNDKGLRQPALDALARIGPDAIVPIINDLRQVPPTGVVEISYLNEALTKIGAPAIEPLIAAIKEKNAALQLNAIVALSSIGEPAIDPLIKLFSDPDANIRGIASTTLARIGKPAVEPLIQVLTDPSAEARMGAALALFAISDRRAIEPLRRSLSDENKWVRLNSAGALAKIDKSETQAVAVLMDATNDYGPDSSDVYRGTANEFLKQVS
ncbi:MAG: HEAT repeat domain-containing protein [Candidatus Bathyarchaeota archaeon]|nr:HEAT repeat domain-containing protein [Candidatus Bathyarchaeota archaeon]